METLKFKTFVALVILGSFHAAASGEPPFRDFKSTAGTKVRACVVGITPEGKLELKTLKKTVEVAIHQLDKESQTTAVLDLVDLMQDEMDRIGAIHDGEVAEAEEKAEASKPDPEGDLIKADKAIRIHLAKAFEREFKSLEEYAHDNWPDLPGDRVKVLDAINSIKRSVKSDQWHRINGTASQLTTYYRGEEGNRVLAEFKAITVLMYRYAGIISGADTPDLFLGYIKRDQNSEGAIKRIDQYKKQFAAVSGAAEKLMKLRATIVAVQESLPKVNVDL